MNRGPYEFFACYFRMNEFFQQDDINWYLHNLQVNNLDTDRGLEWLDAQVRANYFSEVDREPDIENKLLEYLLSQGLGLDGFC